jgi:hypothetical protein
MNETVFKNRWVKLANALGGSYFFKFHSNIYTQGKPDVIGAYCGRPYGLEFKVVDLPKRDSTIVDLMKGVTDLQKRELKRMKEGSWDAYVVVLVRPTNDILYLKWDYDQTFRRDKYNPMSFPVPKHWFPTNF